MTGGLLLRWYRDTLCAEEQHKARELKQDPYELIMAEMAPLPKDIFFLPHFVGAGTPHFDPLSKGAIVGLKVSTSKADLTRSIIDGINYEMKQNIDYFRQNGIVLHEIRSVGGGAKSNTWLQIKASCFGIPVVKPKVSEAVSLGAAILAGYAIGRFKSIEDGVGNMVSIAEVFDPDPELNTIYEEKYLKYKQLYQLLKPFNAKLNLQDAWEFILPGVNHVFFYIPGPPRLFILRKYLRTVSVIILI
jgi:xylulokinase